MNMRRVLPLLFVGLVALGSSQTAFACVCGGEPVKRSQKEIKAAIAREFNDAASVFSGEVIALDTFTVKFKLITMWKGDAFDEFTISTGTKKVSEDRYLTSSCDFNFTVGEKYLVYARATDDHRLVARFCTRTSVLSRGKADTPELDILNPGAYHAPTLAVVPAQAPTSIKPASIYDQDGITVVSPNQSGWTLLKTDKSETVFEKRSEGGIFNAVVKTIRTKTFETDKERLTAWEALKQAEFSKLKQDHLHYNYVKFKGAACLRYDGIFPTEKTWSSKFAYFNVTGYLCPHSIARDSAVQMEFSNHSNTRGLSEDLYSLSDEFFEKLTLPRRQ